MISLILNFKVYLVLKINFAFKSILSQKLVLIKLILLSKFYKLLKFDFIFPFEVNNAIKINKSLVSEGLQNDIYLLLMSLPNYEVNHTYLLRRVFGKHIIKGIFISNKLMN